MLNMLYVLRKEYRDKKIYIWNLNRNSIVVFTRIIFMGVDIHGFVTLQEEYAGKMYMNRPVVTLKQIVDDIDIVILMDDEVPKSIMDMLPCNKAVYWSDALDINEALRFRKIIVYGIGYGAEQLCQVLEKEEIEPEFYCVTKKGGGIHPATSIYRGKKVVEVAGLEQYVDYAIIISVKKDKYRKEILEALSDFQGQVYVEHVISEFSIVAINLMQSIDYAIRNRKSIYLYSRRNMLAKLLEEALAVYDIEICGYVYETEDEEKGIENVYKLAYEGIEDKLIIINEELPELLARARDNIELAGFSLERRNYTSIQGYTDATEVMLSKVKESYDPLVGGSILYSQDRPGWKVYGGGEGIRILVLGGSTSSEVLHPENWVSKLYYRLKQNQFAVTIYNGAHVCNDITAEILRLLRDGSVLRPQIVISMSGVNNLRYKESMNQFNEERMISWAHTLSPDGKYCSGVYYEESLYTFWHRNLQMLRLISDFYGAKFFGFLQPMNITMDHMTLWEKSIYEEEKNLPGARAFAKWADSGQDYCNLMSLFVDQNEMYFDMCHYTDKANAIIASKVWEKILPTMQSID